MDQLVLAHLPAREIQEKREDNNYELPSLVSPPHSHRTDPHHYHPEERILNSTQQWKL